MSCSITGIAEAFVVLHALYQRKNTRQETAKTFSNKISG